LALEIKLFSKGVAWVQPGGGGGRVVLPSPAGKKLGSGNWRKIILNEKIWFSGLKIFKLLIQTKENSTNDCAF
jgi:hypothetical protein